MGTIVTDYPEHPLFDWWHLKQILHSHPIGSHRFIGTHTEMDYDHLHTVFTIFHAVFSMGDIYNN